MVATIEAGPGMKSTESLDLGSDLLMDTYLLMGLLHPKSRMKKPSIVLLLSQRVCMKLES